MAACAHQRAQDGNDTSEEACGILVFNIPRPRLPTPVIQYEGSARVVQKFHWDTGTCACATTVRSLDGSHESDDDLSATFVTQCHIAVKRLLSPTRFSA